MGKEPCCAVTLSNGKVLKEQTKSEVGKSSKKYERAESEEGEAPGNEEKDQPKKIVEKVQEKSKPVEIINEEDEVDPQDQATDSSRKKG